MQPSLEVGDKQKILVKSRHRFREKHGSCDRCWLISVSSQGQRLLVSQVSLSEGDLMAIKLSIHFPAQRVEDNPSIYSSVSFPSERCIEEDLIIMLTMPGLYRKFFLCSPRQYPKFPRVMSAKRATSPQPPRNGSPTNRRPRSAAVPSSPRNLEEEAEPASVVDQWQWSHRKWCSDFIEALPGGAPMSLVWILKRLVSVFINASRRCRKLNENSLPLSEF